MVVIQFRDTSACDRYLHYYPFDHIKSQTPKDLYTNTVMLDTRYSEGMRCHQQQNSLQQVSTDGSF